VPGQSAARLSIGDDIGNIHLSGGVSEASVKFELGAVTIWTTDNLIEQIRVGSGYEGLLLGKVGIGSTLFEVEKEFRSSVQEDEGDNLVVLGVPGLCFETETWNGHEVKDNLDSRITHIFVFRSCS
jgi:hypothetical protein